MSHLLAALCAFIGSEMPRPTIRAAVRRKRETKPAPKWEDLRRRYSGTAWRHRITGQVRDVFDVDPTRFHWGQRCRDSLRGRGIPPAIHRKALAWIGNAEEVK